jgi:hypothetical protein
MSSTTNQFNLFTRSDDGGITTSWVVSFKYNDLSFHVVFDLRYQHMTTLEECYSVEVWSDGDQFIGETKEQRETRHEEADQWEELRSDDGYFLLHEDGMISRIQEAIDRFKAVRFLFSL